MTKCEAERLFKEIDRINEQIEDIREAFQWDPDAGIAGERIADHLARASDALGTTEWEIHDAYQFPLPADSLDLAGLCETRKLGTVDQRDDIRHF
jgi:hypothetical protein